MTGTVSKALTQIPNKRYFTIGEVSKICDVKPHVLRYWEQEFDNLNPSKRRGNRRYYQRSDVQTALDIGKLLYDEGYTISGAKQRLKSSSTPVTQQVLDEIRNELKEIQTLLVG